MLHYPTLTAPGTAMLKDEWLTAAAAARLLGINRVTFYDWLEKGYLKHVATIKPASRTLYSRADLLKLGQKKDPK